MAKLFFSYAHEDERLRNELEKHLSPLKNAGILTTWHDRKIYAGEEFEQEIDEKMLESDVILFLVSPDFLSSDYCMGVEVERAMERHEAGNAIVIPVILRPCDWHDMPFGKLLATPTDGLPVVKHASLDDGFYLVEQEIKRAIEKLEPTAVSQPVRERTEGGSSHIVGVPVPARSRSSNLRMKRSFSDREKDSFIVSSFEYISNYFAESLVELAQRNQGVEGKFQLNGRGSFTAIVYQNGQEVSSCTIELGGEKHFSGGDIVFAFGRQVVSGISEWLTVDDDGYVLGLKAFGVPVFAYEQKLLTEEGAAEYFWGLLMRDLQ